jgi:hypothetical protein
MEGLEMQFAELLASASPEAAEAFRHKILTEMSNFRSAKGEADKLRLMDEALDTYTKQITMGADDEAVEPLGDVPRSPFGRQDETG